MSARPVPAPSPTPILPVPICAAGLAALPGIAHGFFTRDGAAPPPDGTVVGLHCGLSDLSERPQVLANRARIAAALGLAPDRLVSAWQVHGADVATIDTPFAVESRPQVDGLVTTAPGLGLGVLTADCCPVLFADPHARVIGAAHAGWKGALAGIVEATVAAMVARGARRERIVAAVGPSIGPSSYEVGPDLAAPFLARDAANARFFAPGRGDRLQFDLPGFVVSRLTAAGVAAAWTGHDTAADAVRFFSWRRKCLRPDSPYGQMLAVISLGPTD